MNQVQKYFRKRNFPPGPAKRLSKIRSKMIQNFVIKKPSSRIEKENLIKGFKQIMRIFGIEGNFERQNIQNIVEKIKVCFFANFSISENFCVRQTTKIIKQKLKIFIHKLSN